MAGDKHPAPTSQFKNLWSQEKRIKEDIGQVGCGFSQQNGEFVKTFVRQARDTITDALL